MTVNRAQFSPSSSTSSVSRATAKTTAPAAQAAAPAAKGWAPKAASVPQGRDTSGNLQRMGSTIDGWKSNGNVPQSKAAWAMHALGVLSPEKNVNGDGVQERYSGAKLNELPTALKMALGKDLSDVNSVAMMPVDGKNTFLVLHNAKDWTSQNRSGSQRMDLYSAEGTRLGTRTLLAKDFKSGPTEIDPGRNNTIRWPSNG
jgi:hypothetical protein